MRLIFVSCNRPLIDGGVLIDVIKNSHNPDHFGFLESYYHAFIKRRSKIGFWDKYKHYMLDSGGFTAIKTGVPIDVEKYAEFLNKHKIKEAFNLDTKSVEETLKNQKYLDETCPETYIIPVYHLSDYEGSSRELLRDYIVKYPYIAIGGVAMVRGRDDAKEALFKYVFRHTRDKIKVHGLGITQENFLQRYPFYSYDSSSWMAMFRYGRTRIEEKKQVSNLLSRAFSENYNIKKELECYMDFNEFLTDLWADRGVKWNY